MSVSTFCEITGEEVEKRLHLCIKGLIETSIKIHQQDQDWGLAFLVWGSLTVLTRWASSLRTDCPMMPVVAVLKSMWDVMRVRGLSEGEGSKLDICCWDLKLDGSLGEGGCFWRVGEGGGW